MGPKAMPTTVAFLLTTLLFAPSATHAARPMAFDAAANKTHDISAVFAFGDSTLDAGNNNRLPTLVRADHAPYGRDFPGGAATGRFSDGKLMTDYLTASLGIKDVLPAYHSNGLADADAAKGVSFASGGSGLDDSTSMGALVSTFSSQIADFQQFLARVPKAAGIVNKAVFIVSAGTNDVVMNYYVLPFQRMTYTTVDQYHAYLIGNLQSYLQSLYRLGARRFMVAGMPPVGCLPVQMTLAAMQPPPKPRACIAEQNADAERYNAALQQMLTRLEAASPGAKFVYVDIYNALKDMMDHPQKYGFTETGRGCCGTGTMEMATLCTDVLPLCRSPSQFMFFDSVHPTQATYKSLADQFMQSNMLQFNN